MMRPLLLLAAAMALCALPATAQLTWSASAGASGDELEISGAAVAIGVQRGVGPDWLDLRASAFYSSSGDEEGSPGLALSALIDPGHGIPVYVVGGIGLSVLEDVAAAPVIGLGYTLPWLGRRVYLEASVAAGEGAPSGFSVGVLW